MLLFIIYDIFLKWLNVDKERMKWNRKWRGRGRREGRKRGGKRGTETGGRMRSTDII